MSCHSEIIRLTPRRCKAFTLIEAVAAVTLIGIIASSILVVFIRCSSVVRDCGRRMQAFDVARENMETLLGAEALSEQVEYGYSEKYPAVLWVNRVEAFFEPAADEMWLRAVCSAEYEDSTGEAKKVELTHWLTKLNEKQIQQILDARDLLKTAAAQLGLSEPQKLIPDELQPGTTPPASLVPPKDLPQMTPEEIKQWLDQIEKNRSQ